MLQMMDLAGDQNMETVARAALSTRVQLLDAIDRELAARGTAYSEHALRLAEAYSRITAPGC